MTSPSYGTGGGQAADPDQIRRDIERTQSHLSTDVDALTEKVTPGRVVERRMNRARSTAGRWKDKVMGSNPLHSSTHTVSGTHAGGGARETAHHMADSVSGTTSSGASGVSDAASSAAHTVSEAPAAARRQAQGNPLAAGLIAFGAGWLISSLLPASNREQELATQAKDRAGEYGQPVAEAAKQAATEVKDNLSGPAQEAAESVRSTATEAGRTVADEGRSAGQQVQGQAKDSAGHVRDNAQQ
ncbi:DUF3618 domain-containing protein [Pseudonocardia nigra]|uniref:DUF3618 domain-containing protein n=1 Tax=Pseudonocardia nigra TaxID=1921578 RepID=UPI001C5FC97C|nr:DUF3618 domain-containing protein [Pseudonocardia nigra]